MTARGLEGTQILLIDGNNLLHRVARGTSPDFQRELLARLRSAIPPSVPTIVILDGHAVPGTSPRERIGRGFEVRHSGSSTADEALLDEIERRPLHERHGVLLVSDDRALIERARHLGARTQRLDWLQALLTRPVRSQIGSRQAAARTAEPTVDADDERPPWTPGRGATRKRGNPRRRRR